MLYYAFILLKGTNPYSKLFCSNTCVLSKFSASDMKQKL